MPADYLVAERETLDPEKKGGEREVWEGWENSTYEEHAKRGMHNRGCSNWGILLVVKKKKKERKMKDKKLCLKSQMWNEDWHKYT